MGAAENKQLIQNMFIEVAKGNRRIFLDIMADDVRFTVIGTTWVSGTFTGKGELVGKVMGPLMAQLDGGIAITPDNFIADGDYVAVQARGKATTKAGKPYNNTYCQVYRIINSKVQEVTEYLDTELVTAAFGK